MKLLLSFFILGLTFGSGPCLASCGPLLVSYIAGTNKGVKNSVWVYLLFSLARIAVYAILGLAVFFLGELITRYLFASMGRYFFFAAGLFIMIIGSLVAVGKNPEYKWCAKMQNIFLHKDTLTVILLGLFVGILPCIPLLTILSSLGLMAHSWRESISLALAFGLGTVTSPLLLLAIFAGVIPQSITIHKPIFYRIFQIICGLIMVILGVHLVTRVF